MPFRESGKARRSYRCVGTVDLEDCCRIVMRLAGAKNKGDTMQRVSVPRRVRLISVVAVAIFAAVGVFAVGDVGAAGTAAPSYPDSTDPLCVQHPQLCTEQLDPVDIRGREL